MSDRPTPEEAARIWLAARVGAAATNAWEHDLAALIAAREAELAAQVAALEAEIANLVIALDESVALQSHQAKMLNMYDGGERRQFENGAAWVARLIDCGRIGKARSSA